jgi:tRNA (guanosine-2'-O-)-methyltransferase
MLERRTHKIINALHRRQPDVTIVMENIHDPHNVSAMFRSADAVGIQQVQLVYTKDKFPRIGKKSSSSANKWIDYRQFRSMAECVDRLKEEGFIVYATRLDDHSQSLFTLDLTKKTAFIFGNEHNGVSDEAVRLADATAMIPMMGMIQSLNVSVACAVTVYEVLRQRMKKNMYTTSRYTETELKRMLSEWLKK